MAVKIDKVKLDIYKYANYKHQFNLFSDVDKSIPSNTTGYTGKLQFRATPDSDVLFEATTENGYLTVTQTAMTLEIPAVVIAVWPFTSCQYDGFVISPSGKPTAVVRGPVVVTKSITHTT